MRMRVSPVAVSLPSPPVRRAMETAGFIARTYRTLHLQKTGRLTPGQAGRELARDATAMGPLYTKLAQFISARRESLDPDFAEALSAVQDSAPVTVASDPPVVRGVEVEPVPIASASIADVYRGVVTKTGRAVVVKRRRKGVKTAVLLDLPLLSGAMRLAGACGVPGATNMYELIDQSRDMVTGELDFRTEAAASEEFRRHFADVPWLVVPRVLRASEDTLVAEYVPSRKAALVVAPNPALARRLMDLYMLMLGGGLVHADPHPGNLGFLADGSIVLYDFGAMLRVPAGIQQSVARVVTAGVTKNADGLLDALETMGVLTVEGTGTRRGVRRILRRVLNGDVHAELQNAPEFTSSDSAKRVVTFGTTFIYLTRTLTLIDGTCRALDPDFDYDFSRWLEAPDAMAGISTMVSIARDAAAIPATLQTMHADLEEFQLRVVDELDGFKRVSSVGSAVLVAATAGGVGYYFILFYGVHVSV